MTATALPEGIAILGPIPAGYEQILTPQAITFVAKLARKFENRRRELMVQRVKQQAEFDIGKLPDFKPEAPITEAGLRNNISVGIQYIGAWLAGNGCVPVYNLMEDAATAEISRSQIWQWMRSPKGVLDDGRKVTKDMFRKMLPEELDRVRRELGEAAWAAGRYEEAAKLFDDITASDHYVEFLTLPGYELLAREPQTRATA